MLQASTSSALYKSTLITNCGIFGALQTLNKYTKNEQALQDSSLTEVTAIRLLAGEYMNTLEQFT